jgi:hypothetical protein
MVGISNIYIESILRIFDLHLWDGVVSSDEIEFASHLERDFATVVNFSKHNERGTHFVCLFQIGGKLFLFDSLATPDLLLPSTLREVMLAKNGTRMLPAPIQHILSEFCGFYSMYCVLWLSLPTHVRLMFSPTNFSQKNLFENDDLCISYIVSMIDYLKIKLSD